MPLLIRAIMNFIRFWHKHTIPCSYRKGRRRLTLYEIEMRWAIRTVHGKGSVSKTHSAPKPLCLEHNSAFANVSQSVEFGIPTLHFGTPFTCQLSVR